MKLIVDERWDEEVPYADSTTWYKCTHCENLHVQCYDEDMNMIFRLNFSREMLEDMLEVIKGRDSVRIN